MATMASSTGIPMPGKSSSRLRGSSTSRTSGSSNSYQGGMDSRRDVYNGDISGENPVARKSQQQSKQKSSDLNYTSDTTNARLSMSENPLRTSKRLSGSGSGGSGSGGSGSKLPSSKLIKSSAYDGYENSPYASPETNKKSPHSAIRRVDYDDGRTNENHKESSVFYDDNMISGNDNYYQNESLANQSSILKAGGEQTSSRVVDENTRSTSSNGLVTPQRGRSKQRNETPTDRSEVRSQIPTNSRSSGSRRSLSLQPVGRSIRSETPTINDMDTSYSKSSIRTNINNHSNTESSIIFGESPPENVRNSSRRHNHKQNESSIIFGDEDLTKLVTPPRTNRQLESSFRLGETKSTPVTTGSGGGKRIVTSPTSVEESEDIRGKLSPTSKVFQSQISFTENGLAPINGVPIAPDSPTSPTSTARKYNEDEPVHVNPNARAFGHRQSYVLVENPDTRQRRVTSSDASLEGLKKDGGSNNKMNESTNSVAPKVKSRPPVTGLNRSSSLHGSGGDSSNQMDQPSTRKRAPSLQLGATGASSIPVRSASNRRSMEAAAAANGSSKSNKSNSSNNSNQSPTNTNSSNPSPRYAPSPSPRQKFGSEGSKQPSSAKADSKPKMSWRETQSEMSISQINVAEHDLTESDMIPLPSVPSLPRPPNNQLSPTAIARARSNSVDYDTESAEKRRSLPKGGGLRVDPEARDVCCVIS